jgi:hypothetical protein
MNELYEKTIEVEGRVYRYDPEYDCYCRSQDQTPETARERWTKVTLATTLLIVLLIAGPPLLEWLK